MTVYENRLTKIEIIYYSTIALSCIVLKFLMAYAFSLFDVEAHYQFSNLQLTKNENNDTSAIVGI